MRTARLGDLVEAKYGKALPQGMRRQGAVPVYGSSGAVGWHDAAVTSGPAIVIGRKGSAGAISFSDVPCWPIDTTYYIDQPGPFQIEFLDFLLRSLGLTGLDRSTAIPGLSRDQLYDIEVPVPPAADQAAVADLLKKAAAYRADAVRHLQAARRAIERFRKSVLARACSGRLSAGWREARPAPPGQPGDVDGILAACRAERGISLGRRPRPAGLPSDFGLPGLPAGWSWQPLGDLTLRIGDVDHRMPKAQPAGIPYISTKDFTASEIDFDHAKVIAQEDFDRLARKIMPEQGDILLSRYGTVGQVRPVATSRRFQASYSIAIIKTCKTVDMASWLAAALSSPLPQHYMSQHIRASAQPDLGLQHIRTIPVPVPPLAEQAEILRVVGGIFAAADRLLARVQAGQARVDRASQAILAKAFGGDA